jgi:hypothetical protein
MEQAIFYTDLTIGGSLSAGSDIDVDDLVVNNGASFALADYNLTIDATTTNNGTLTIGSGDITATNLFTNNNVLTGGSGTWTFNDGFANGSSATVTATSGSWNNYDYYDNDGTFVHNDGSMFFTYNADYTDYVFNPNGEYNNMTFYGMTKTWGRNLYPQSPINVKGDFTISTYQFRGIYTTDITVEGNVNVNSGYIGPDVDFYFTGSGDQTFRVGSSGTFSALDVGVDKAPGTVTMISNISSGMTLTIDNGTFYTNGYNIVGATELINNGTLKLQGGESLGFGTKDTDTGTVEYVGDGGATSYASLIYGNDYNNLKINSLSGLNTFTAAAATDVNGSFELNSGTFNAPSTTLTIAKDFDFDNGTFNHSSGSVILDTANDSNIYGTIDFNDISSTVAGKTIIFEANKTVTVAGEAQIKGSSDTDIVVRSSEAGTQFSFDPAGTKDIDYIDVKDSNNISGSYIDPANYVDSGSNLNWFSTHTITASAGSNGTIIPSGDVTVSDGEDQVFSFAADVGYEASEVIIDGESQAVSSSYTFDDVLQDHTITVNFAVAHKTIYISHTGDGSTNPSVPTSIEYGSDQTIYFTPSAGNYIKDVKVGQYGGSMSSVGAVSSYTFTNITQNMAVEVTFAKTVTPTPTPTPAPSGSSSYNNNPSDTSSSATIKSSKFIVDSLIENGSIIVLSETVDVNEGGEYIFEVRPNQGYTIEDIYDNGVSIKDKCNFENNIATCIIKVESGASFTEKHDISANFTETQGEISDKEDEEREGSSNWIWISLAGISFLLIFAVIALRNKA